MSDSVCVAKAVITTMIQLPVDRTVRLPFDCNSTALRPLDDIRYDRIGFAAQTSCAACSGAPDYAPPLTLTFDLLILKVVSESHVTWATCVPILASLFST